MTSRRIGFCCKYIENDLQIAGIKPRDSARQYAVSTVTRTWMLAQTAKTVNDRLWTLVKGNVEAVRRLVKLVGDWQPERRMLRIGSDILPLYTEPSFSQFYRQTDVQDYLARNFAVIGDTARAQAVRLSFHPGQFCVLASASDEVVRKSIEEFEYHTDMARWMGFGRDFHDHGFKINVHISGRRGAAGIRQALGQMSPEARNLITIENEESAYGLDDVLELADVLPIVLDVHHHWIHDGDYLQPGDDRVRRILDSWRGCRPAMHYSVSRENVLTGHCRHTRPHHASLTARGFNQQKLRAHSDYYWNQAMNDYALSFWDRFDIQCESKAKNLAQLALYNYAQAWQLSERKCAA